MDHFHPTVPSNEELFPDLQISVGEMPLLYVDHRVGSIVDSPWGVPSSGDGPLLSFPSSPTIVPSPQGDSKVDDWNDLGLSIWPTASHHSPTGPGTTPGDQLDCHQLKFTTHPSASNHLLVGHQQSLVSLDNSYDWQDCSDEFKQFLTDPVPTGDAAYPTHVMDTSQPSPQDFEWFDQLMATQPASVSSTTTIDTPLQSPSLDFESFMKTEQIPDISDNDLIALGTKELNRRIHHYPENIRQLLKHKRRTLKNRNYAQNCRSRKCAQQSDMEKENVILKKENGELKEKVKRYENTLKDNILIKEILRLRCLLEQCTVKTQSSK